MTLRARILASMVGAALMLSLTSSASAQTATLGGRDDVEIGAPYLKEVFTDWELRCVKQEDGLLEPCQMYQLLMNEAGSPVAEFTFIALPPGGTAIAGATVVSPLETLLTQDLLIRIDEGDPKRFPFDFCTVDGCYAQLGFTEAEIARFKTGGVAKVRIVAVGAPQTPVVLDASLKGFTAAFDWLLDRVQAVANQ